MHVASAFPLAGQFRAVFGLRAQMCQMVDSVALDYVHSETGENPLFHGIVTVERLGDSGETTLRHFGGESGDE